MAIQLNTQTAQQQKAPFSAFDSTSSFRSGGRELAQGFDKVAQAASNIQTARNQQKQKAQDLLAYKAGQEYSVDFKQRSDALTAAITQGDPATIAEARESFNQLESMGLDSYSPGLNLGNDSAQRYAAKNQATFKAASTSFDTQQNSRVIYGETTSYLEEQRTAATKAVVDNPYGLDEISLHETLTRFTGQDEGYQVRYDALSTPEQQDGFKKDLASNTTVVSMQNIKTATTLDQLERRKEILDEFVTQGVETLGLPTSSVEKIENAYRAAKKALSDPTYKLKVGTEAYSKLNSSIGELFTASSSTNMGDKVNKLAAGLVSYRQNHPESAAENKEQLDGLMATLALFSPARDKDGNEVGESFVDSLALSFLRYGVKNTGNLQDFMAYVPEMELDSERAARLALKEQYDAIDPSVRSRMQTYIDNRTKLVMDGVNGGDLTALGNLYPRLESHIKKNELDQVRLFYKQVVLPQLTGVGLGTGLIPTGQSGRGALNGQLRLPTEWAFLGDKEINTVDDPKNAAQELNNIAVANQGFEGSAVVALAQGEKTESGLLKSMTLRVAATGGDVSGFTDAMTARAQVASVNKDNKDIDKIFEDYDTGEGFFSSEGKLGWMARIKNLEGGSDNIEGEFWRQQLRGHIAQSLKEGKTPQQAIDEAQKYNDETIVPLFGVVAQSTQGHNVRLSPSTVEKFLSVGESRANFGIFPALYYSLKNESSNQINERDLAEFTKASVIALAMRQNPDLYQDTTRGDMGYRLGTNPLTPGYSRTGGQGPGAGEGEPLEPQDSKDITDKQLKALYNGLNNNEYHELGIGMLGARGDGIPVVNIPETTFKTEQLPDGTVVEREYYYMQFPNADGNYEEGKGTYVAVDDVNRLLDEVVRRATDMMPFNQSFGDITSSATGNQNSVWELSAGLYLD